MLKKTLTSALMLASVTLATTASAENYAGVNVSKVYVGADTSNQEENIGVLSARLGTTFGEHLSGEIRVGTGLEDVDQGSVEYSLQSLFGLYLRSGTQISPQAFVYGIAGYTEIKTEREWFRGKDSQTSYGPSIGFGVDVDLNETLLNVEYIAYENEFNYNINGISVGLFKKFY